MIDVISRALTGTPEHAPRNRMEQRAVWQNRVQMNRDFERLDVNFLTSYNNGLIKIIEIIEQGLDERFTVETLKEELNYRTNFIGHLFSAMHRAVYFDGLLELGDGDYEYDMD